MKTVVLLVGLFAIGVSAGQARTVVESTGHTYEWRVDEAVISTPLGQVASINGIPAGPGSGVVRPAGSSRQHPNTNICSCLSRPGSERTDAK